MAARAKRAQCNNFAGFSGGRGVFATGGRLLLFLVGPACFSHGSRVRKIWPEPNFTGSCKKSGSGANAHSAPPSRRHWLRLFKIRSRLFRILPHLLKLLPDSSWLDQDSSRLHQNLSRYLKTLWNFLSLVQDCWKLVYNSVRLLRTSLKLTTMFENSFTTFETFLHLFKVLWNFFRSTRPVRE